MKRKPAKGDLRRNKLHIPHPVRSVVPPLPTRIASLDSRGSSVPFATPLKTTKKGAAAPPFLDFPRSSVCAEIISDLQNAIQMRIWQTGEVIEILCGCSGCILYGRACCVTAFRLSYVKYSTGAKSDLHGLSCAWETRFYGRPKGVQTTETKR